MALIKNGRKSYIEISKEMNVTEASIRKRVNKMVNNKLLKVSAYLDLQQLGFDFIALVGLQVGLSDIKVVGTKLAEQPNICYVANVTGGHEFLMLVVAKNSREFAAFMEMIISKIPGILRTETFVVLNTYKGKQTGFDITQFVENLEISSKKKVKGSRNNSEK